jgi:glycine cleavage system H protein
MSKGSSKTRFYKRATFITHLPESYLYSPTHSWVARDEADGSWKVGLTKFATRMLGDMVDFQFEKKSQDSVSSGEIIGWVEGFKAISDIYCIAEGSFHRFNAHLKTDISQISKKPYGDGWLYSISGKPDSTCVEIDEYIAILDKTIDRILEQQQKSNED